LTLARDDAGRREAGNELVDLGRLSIELVDDLSASAAAAGLVLACDCADRVLVRGAHGHLRRIVSNLVSNALKFTPPGGRVSLTVDRSQGRARVCVRDTGPGIPPDLLPRVFERFVRGDPSRAANRGTGLGLAVVASLVRTLGGTVIAESEPGQGATFTVNLPQAADAPLAPPSPPSPATDDV
jgi:signal transduction histidine kinase